MAATLSALTPVDASAEIESGPRLFTIDEFERLPDDLFPQGERAELIEGLIYTKMGQNDPHRFTVHYAARALRMAFGSEFDLMIQSPLRLSEHSQPEPDLFVFSGSLEEYEQRAKAVGEPAVLVVEVSDTTLADDRGRKARLYAKYGIPEYWIVNLQSRTLEVRRGPRPETEDYFETLVYREDDSAAANGQSIAVADLLPKATE